MGPTDSFGRTKLSVEKAVASRWPRHAILCHSLVFGPPPPSPVEPAKLWLQSLDGQLKAGVRFRWSVQSMRCWAAGRCRVNPTLEEASAARILWPDDPGLCGLLNAHTRSAHHAATHSWLQKRVELPNDQASTWCCGGNACTCPTPRCTEGELSDWMPLSPGSGSLPSTCGTWCGPCTSASGPQGTQCPHERHRDGRLIHACAAGRWLLEGCTDS